MIPSTRTINIRSRFSARSLHRYKYSCPVYSPMTFLNKINTYEVNQK